MSWHLKSLNDDKEMMQTSLNRSRMKNAKLFDEISDLNKEIYRYKRRLERAYRPIDATYETKPRRPVYDSYSTLRCPEIYYHAPSFGFYDEDWEIKRAPAPADPVVQKSYRTKDGVLHHIYTVKSALKY
ncbi:Hypothetical predicted protein [Octopus vulgaris]|uniref:Uncharacterized protein n=2 Tax=Octopus TaxID=6643 RepID=A0AA36F9Q4_OCTVU|nr:uncharacterized protein LOC115215725 [Octopus sinensis]CAI9729409.1 Hypothetical predicted protein [Octopus vulgaris]